MIECVIFDLDGVIVSTDKYHYRAWKIMADSEGIYFNEEINNKLRGISRMESLEVILESSSKTYTKEEKQRLAEYKNQIYVHSLDELSKNDILPGIIETLEVIKDKGIKICIGSSSKNAKKILRQIGLTDMFDAISDGTNITNSKPDPEVFLKAADMVGIEYKNCAVVEDAHSGIIAAKNAGMLAFAVGDAKTSSYKDYDFEQLLEIIKNKE